MMRLLGGLRVVSFCFCSLFWVRMEAVREEMG
jgi:hypothetical protein